MQVVVSLRALITRATHLPTYPPTHLLTYSPRYLLLTYPTSNLSTLFPASDILPYPKGTGRYTRMYIQYISTYLWKLWYGNLVGVYYLLLTTYYLLPNYGWMYILYIQRESCFSALSYYLLSPKIDDMSIVSNRLRFLKSRVRWALVEPWAGWASSGLIFSLFVSFSLWIHRGNICYIYYLVLVVFSTYLLKHHTAWPSVHATYKQVPTYLPTGNRLPGKPRHGPCCDGDGVRELQWKSKIVRPNQCLVQSVNRPPLIAKLIFIPVDIVRSCAL